MLEENYFTNCSLVSDSLFINIEKLCNSFVCCFLRSVTTKLNSVHAVLPVSYSSHLDVLLTACHTSYLNHDKCFLSVGWLTNTTVYCSVHCTVTAVQHSSTQHTRWVYYIFYLLCILCQRYILLDTWVTYLYCNVLYLCISVLSSVYLCCLLFCVHTSCYCALFLSLCSLLLFICNPNWGFSVLFPSRKANARE
jgi:hypothetical protein